MTAGTGCQVAPPDAAGEISRNIGIDNAIAFHGQAELVDGDAEELKALSPAQAVRLALAHDARIQSSLAKVRVAEAEANQARLLPNPILAIDVRVPQGAGSNTAFEATLTGDLVALLQKPGLISAADNRLRGSVADAFTTVLDVIAEVETAYSAARSVDAEIANANARQEILQKLRNIAQKRLSAGEGTKLDVISLDSQSMQATLDIADLALERTTQRLTLARLIGQPRSAAAWRLSPWEAATQTLGEEAAWIEAALHRRPEIAAQVWELKALGGDLAAAGFEPLAGGELGAHSEHDPNWRVGPTVSFPLPIFDFGQASRAKITAQQQATRNDLLQQQRMVIQDVRLAYATVVHSATALGDFQDKLLPLQRQQLDLAQRSYQSGDVDLATFLLAETNLQLTQAKIIELQENLAVARSKLLRAAGGGIPEIQPAAEAPASRPSIGGPP